MQVHAFEYRFQWYSHLPPGTLPANLKGSEADIKLGLETLGWMEEVQDGTHMQFGSSDQLRDYVCVVFAVDVFGNDSNRVISNKVTTNNDPGREPPNTNFSVIKTEVFTLYISTFWTFQLIFPIFVCRFSTGSTP